MELSVLRSIPQSPHGYVQDLRVRWALEEAGLSYEVVLIDESNRGSDAYRRWQPFGQVPAFRDGPIEMFESGAIVLRIASMSEALSPRNAAGHARVSSWVFAALNSVEPVVTAYREALEDDARDHSTRQRRTRALDGLRGRLTELQDFLSGKPYLEGVFSAGDLMMTTVLRELSGGGVLERFPSLEAFRLRCEQRPAFKRALRSQLETFRQNEPRAAPSATTAWPLSGPAPW